MGIRINNRWWTTEKESKDLVEAGIDPAFKDMDEIYGIDSFDLETLEFFLPGEITVPGLYGEQQARLVGPTKEGNTWVLSYNYNDDPWYYQGSIEAVKVEGKDIIEVYVKMILKLIEEDWVSASDLNYNQC
jgi:hypothetical protein